MKRVGPGGQTAAAETEVARASRVVKDVNSMVLGVRRLGWGGWGKVAAT